MIPPPLPPETARPLLELDEVVVEYPGSGRLKPGFRALHGVSLSVAPGETLDLFVEIQEATGVAYLFVTHDLAVVRHISHRVAVLYRGEVVETGAATKITESPDHPYTRRLLLAAMVPDPDRQAQRRAERRRFAERQARKEPAA